MRFYDKFLMAIFVAYTLSPSLKAKDVTQEELANAFYWNAKDDAGKIIGGEWVESANWLQQGSNVESYPNDSSVSVAFTNSINRSYTVKLSQDASVSSLYVHCKVPSRSPQTLLTLDLGGNTLSVKDMVRIGWAWNPYPALTVTNGTLEIGSDLRPGYDSNVTSSMARFFAYGSCTTVKTARVYWGMRPESPYAPNGMEVFRVAGGARFETTADSAGVCFTSGEYPNFYYFSGKGTVAKFSGGLEIRKLGSKGYTSVFVTDGAKMELDGYYENSDWGQVCRNCIGRITSGNSLIIDNATFESSNYPLVIGDLDNEQQTGSANKLVVSNNAQVVLKNSSAPIWLGRAGTIGNSMATNNWLYVMDGASVTGLAGIVVGQRGHAENNHILVKDAHVKVPYITLGEYYTGVASNCWIHIEGYSSEIVLTGNNGLKIQSGGGLEFKIGPQGYSKTPIVLEKGRLDITTQGGSYKIKPLMPKLRIIAEEFARTNPKTKVTLISCEINSTAELMMLATNSTIVVENEIYAGSLLVSADGKSLSYETPAEIGTCIILR